MPCEYDDLPFGTIVRPSDGTIDAGVIEDGDPVLGVLDIRWASWPTDTRPTQPEAVVRATSEWLSEHGFEVRRAI